MLVTNDDPVVRAMVMAHNVDHVMTPSLDHSIDWLQGVRPSVVLSDSNGLDRRQAEALRALAPVVNIAPQGPAKWYVTSSLLHCAVLGELPPADATATVQGGPRFASVSPSLRMLRPSVLQTQEVRRIVVSMGGADAAGLTFVALDALRRIDLPGTAISVVVGAGFTDLDRLEAEIELDARCQLVQNCNGIAEQLAGADLGILAMGTTTYEASAVGLASVNLCPSAFHARLARHYADEGMLLSAGQVNSGAADRLAHNVARLCEDSDLRLALRRRSLELVDGHGTDRIIDEMEALRLRSFDPMMSFRGCHGRRKRQAR